MNPIPLFLKSVVRSRSWPAVVVGAAVLVAGGLGHPATSRSQSGAGASQTLTPDSFNALVGQIRKQQEQIAANQTKIETQLATAKEEVRQVKIYAGRTGSPGRR